MFCAIFYEEKAYIEQKHVLSVYLERTASKDDEGQYYSAIVGP